MDVQHFIDALDFENHTIVDQKVEPKSALESHTLIADRDRYLLAK